MNTLFQWFIRSSANPEKLAMTAKGLVVFVPTLVIAFSLFGGRTVTPESLTELINSSALFLGGAATLIGLGRKVYYSFKKI